MPEEENKKEDSPEQEGQEAPGNEDENEAQDHSPGGDLTSPLGIMALLTALLFDGLGFGFLTFMVDDCSLLEIFGGLIIGGMVFLRKGKISQDLIKKAGKRFLTVEIIELIPYLGGVAPSWTWLVIKTFRE